MSYHFWTEDEINILVCTLKRYDYNWEEVQRRKFPKLTVAQIKNKFYSNKQYKVIANQSLAKKETPSNKHISDEAQENIDIYSELTELFIRLNVAIE
ncbi:Conserved_hypothetical protein [Hexamita inflata]|uniref:Myb-like domain-containing protein n=1 Tax=Hexamita inflata TaxID=28002 RepID=A0AA86R6K7_9EUKA|nr:Conserved hypothetical protein [Hexamita inflata]